MRPKARTTTRIFGKCSRSLLDDQPGQLDAYDEHRRALYKQLLGLTKEVLDLDPEHRVHIERVLRQFMCRTERHSVATDPSAMIADTWRDQLYSIRNIGH